MLPIVHLISIFLTQVDIERVESFPATVPNEASNIPSVNEEDNRSETASSGYASVQGTDEPAPEEPASSESKRLIGFTNCVGTVRATITIWCRFFDSLVSGV